MTDPSGGMTKVSDGADIAIIGQLSTPDFLGFLEPLVIIPHAVPTHTADAPVGLVAVLVSTPELVPTIADLIASTLDVPDSSKVKVTTNKDLAALRGSISTQLGDFGGSLVLAISLSPCYLSPPLSSDSCSCAVKISAGDEHLGPLRRL